MSKTNEVNNAEPERTRQINISDDLLTHQNIQNSAITFHLGSIKPAEATNTVLSQFSKTELPVSPVITPNTPAEVVNTPKERLVFGITPPSIVTPQPQKINSSSASQVSSVQKRNTPKITKRIWHLLEFISLTGAIFMFFFLILNFDSYSQLFFSKLDQIQGKTAGQNFYSTQAEKTLKNSANPINSVKPLPISQNVEQTKKQIPPLTMEITPPDFRIVIPRVAKNVPVVPIPIDKLIQKDWAALENQIQDGLKNGVVHFPGTAYPGQKGNVVITGHSSYFPWDAGRFKDVFALLHQVNVGDQVIIFDDQKKYIYEVYEKKVVTPDKVDVLTQSGEDRLTLITCTPVGTNLKRLVVLAKPIK